LKLAQKINSFIGVGALVTLSALLGVTFFIGRSGLIETLGKQQIALTTQTLDKVDRVLFEHLTDIQNIAEQPLFSFLLTADPKDATTVQANQAAQIQLSQLITNTNLWNVISLVTTQGTVQLSSNQTLASMPVTGPDLTALRSVMEKKTPYYSSIITLDGSSTIIYAAPIFSDPSHPAEQSPIGAIIGHANWDSVRQILTQLSDSEMRLYDGQGILLAASEPDVTSTILQSQANNPTVSYALHHSEGTALLTDIDSGGRAVVSFTPEKGFSTYTGLGLIAIEETPYKVISDLIYPILIQAGSASLGIVLLITAAATLLIYRTVLRPIKQLTATAEKISAGNSSAKAIIQSHDEIGTLATAFNRMTETLSNSYRQLKDQNEQISHEQARLAFSINSLALGFILTEGTDTVVTINGAVTVLLELPKSPSLEDPAPYNFATLANALSPSFDWKSAVATCFTTRDVVSKRDIFFKDRYFDVFISPIVVHHPETRTLGTVTLIEDVTEERNLQRSKDEFLSIASHELRTPLTAIRGNASLLQLMIGKETLAANSQLPAMIEDIHSSSIRLIEIVNDFLDISHVEQGKVDYHLEPFSIKEIIEEVAKETSSLLTEKSLTLRIEGQETLAVQADRNRIKQVIYNLIGNAIKYTETGGITVSLAEESGSAVIRFTDTGHGIPAELQTLLFHKFQQAHQDMYTRDTAKSTGLGLYISRLLVVGMGGTLDLEWSRKDVGSTFILKLPLAK